MSDLYLRGVEFSNFRIYGDSYAFEFPDGPGITIITGGNGLGKTSFFDGVEWGLTNQVGRFSDFPSDGRRNTADPLTRIGAPKKSHRVSLHFSDGSVIDRGADFDAEEKKIIELLKRPEWAEIGDLHGYLSITHFFGQASAQRFSLKKPTDQWEALKGPAGVDRVNALRQRISGPGVTRAFTRALEERTASLQNAQADLASWTDLVGERDRALQLASSEHAVAPREVIEQAHRLSATIGAVIDRSAESAQVLGATPEGILEAVSSLLRTALDRSNAEAATLDDLVRSLTAFEGGRSEKSTLEALVQSTEERLINVRDELRFHETKLLEAGEAVRVSDLEVSHIRNRLVVLGRIAIAVKQLNDAVERQALLDAQSSAAELAVADASAQLQKLREQQTAALAVRADRRTRADQLEQARKRAQISRVLAALLEEIGRVSLLFAGRDQVALRNKRDELTEELATSSQRVIDATSALRQHDDRARSVVEAVTAIAHRLRHDDTSCPVCATEFEPGELLRLVQRQIAEGPTSASGIASTLAEARLEVEALQRQIAAVERDLVECAALEATLTQHRARESELRQQLVEAGGAADGSYDNRAVETLEADLKVIDEQLATSDTPQAISARIGEVEAALKAETLKRTSTQQLLSVASDEIQACRSFLLQHPDTWTQADGLIVDLPAMHAASEQMARDAGEKFAAATSAVAAAQASRDASQAAQARETGVVATANARLAGLTRELQEIRQRWIAAGLSGEPEQGLLASQRASLTARDDRLNPVSAALERLTAGYRKWLEDEQLRKLTEDVVGRMKSVQASSEAESLQKLVQRVDQAQQSVELAKVTRKKVEDYGVRMKDQARTYAGEVLVPLNATIKRFARALMTGSETAVTYKAEHHAARSELRPTIVQSDLDGRTRNVEMNPSLYFSEGQLSSLSVAALFAASTSFGWSRWRGLLLDDPLQHNDVIHASAFMDLLRQMVLSLGYQIVLSTHDSAEAEFLIRKCRSSGINYRVHELAPKGPNGLVTPDGAVSWAAQG